MQLCVRCAAECLCFAGLSIPTIMQGHPIFTCQDCKLDALIGKGLKAVLVQTLCKINQVGSNFALGHMWLTVVYLAMTHGSRCCLSSFKTLVIHCFQWRLGDLEAGLAGSSPPLPPVVLPCHTQDTLRSAFHCSCSGGTLQLAA
jgi:hypothetical protein